MNAQKINRDSPSPSSSKCTQTAHSALSPKAPPAAVLIKRAAKLAKASGEPNKEKVGSVTRADLIEIIEIKKEDLNAASEEAAISMLSGTARSMGILVEG